LDNNGGVKYHPHYFNLIFIGDFMKDSSVGDKEQIEELKNQVSQLTEIVKQLTEKSVSKQRKPRESVKERTEKQPKKEELVPNSYIKIMSLVKNPLNLSTKPHGRGKTFHFENFGEVKTVFYSELLDIIENHPSFFEAGYFYILDSRVIEANNYGDVYSRILTKEKMEEIFSNSSNAYTSSPLDFKTIANCV
jgi:hypothetical protein